MLATCHMPHQLVYAGRQKIESDLIFVNLDMCTSWATRSPICMRWETHVSYNVVRAMARVYRVLVHVPSLTFPRQALRAPPTPWNHYFAGTVLESNYNLRMRLGYTPADLIEGHKLVRELYIRSFGTCRKKYRSKPGSPLRHSP